MTPKNWECDEGNGARGGDLLRKAKCATTVGGVPSRKRAREEFAAVERYIVAQTAFLKELCMEVEQLQDELRQYRGESTKERKNALRGPRQPSKGC